MKKEEFEILLNADRESEHLEFKEGKDNFNFDAGDHSICGYSIAIANEGGGKFILGVSDKIPRQVKGTRAFKNINKMAQQIFDRIHRRVDVEEFNYDGKRVLILHIPSRPIGEPLEFRGQYLMRIGDSLRPMTPDQYKKISQEAIKDYSSKVMPGALFSDLSPLAIIELRKLLNQSGRVEKKDVNVVDDKQLLTDLGLIVEDKITVAAMVLLGLERSLKRFLPHAEIRFGYKISDSEMKHQDIQIYSEGYLNFYNRIWEKINSRNLTLNIPQGVRVLEKKAFDEETIREALNNAIIHRDYTESETTFITQSQQAIMFASPGGFLEGITIKNIADETKTRNKLIADVLYKCGFVEQFGYGVNLMIKNQLSLGKSLPDYSASDKHHVVLRLNGKIQDMEFARYVFLVAYRRQKVLNDQELVILNKIKNGDKINSQPITQNLLELGLIEHVGTNKYILSRKYYLEAGNRGEYTRKKGLDKETKKALIVKHIKEWGRGYMKEFTQVLNGVPKPTISRYVDELKEDGIIELVGNPQIVKGKNRAYWRLKRGKKFTSK
jgi:ATP-dependent DNA helicase RecG